MLFVLGAPRPALACSIACYVGFTPAASAPLRAHLPANGAFVAIAAGSTSTVDVVRTRLGVETTTTVDVTRPDGVFALPDAQPGDRFHVSAMLACGGSPSLQEASTDVEITEAAPVPTVLGVLDVSTSQVMPVAVWDNRGSCTSDLSSAVATYEIALDPALDPWRDALVLGTMLDDRGWSTGIDPRLGPYYVYAPCVAPLESQTNPGGTTTGEHVLRMEGRLRGLDATLSSNEVAFELTCSAPSSGGCAVAHATPGRGAHAFAVGMVALAAIARRRRRHVVRT